MEDNVVFATESVPSEPKKMPVAEQKPKRSGRHTNPETPDRTSRFFFTVS